MSSPKNNESFMLPRVKLQQQTVIDMKNETQHPMLIARRAFGEQRTKCVKFRRRQLKGLLQMYREHYDEMLEVLHSDLGKHKQESSVFEVEFIINDLRNVLSNFVKWSRPEARYKRFMNFFDTLRVYKDPYGVVLIIGAWNYPIQSALLPLAAAIAAGNCVVLKPSSIARATAAFIANTLPNYIDTDCYHVMIDDDHSELLKQHRFDYIFYTGQITDGRLVHHAAAETLTPTTLVIGGKNPVYIDDDVNLELAAKRILWGKCVNAGQTCIGPEYILCTRTVQDKLLKHVPKILAEWYGGNPTESPDFGRMITQEHYEKVVSLLKGKKVAYGGAHDAKTRYIQPTLLIDVSPNDEIMHTETYAPILPIIPIKDLNEAIAFINAREKPLAMYIFSTKRAHIDRLLQSTSAGGVTVNDTLLHIGAESLPFGGVGNSGMGRYHGKYTFDTFTHEKSVLRKPLNRLVEKIESARYPPYSEFKMWYTKFAMERWRSIDCGWISYAFVFILGMVVALILFQV